MKKRSASSAEILNEENRQRNAELNSKNSANNLRPFTALENDKETGTFKNLDQLPSQQGESEAKMGRNIQSWRCCRYQALPKWLQDNEFIHKGYRPPLPSFSVCFKSVFRMHTETGNIWTHLVGCLAFMLIMIYFITRSHEQIHSQEKYVFSVFFCGAICCLGFSSVYHTLICHSEHVGKVFSKFDYLGIALQIMGSFVPWLYYGFYCETFVRNTYMVLTATLGIASIIASLWDKFGHSRYRKLRASIFSAFGLSGVLPAIHFLYARGFVNAFKELALGYLLSMAVLYLFGAYLYAARIPERYYPGKCDLIFHSHQIFHVLVIVAALVCLRGMSLLADQALSENLC